MISLKQQKKKQKRNTKKDVAIVMRTGINVTGKLNWIHTISCRLQPTICYIKNGKGSYGMRWICLLNTKGIRGSMDPLGHHINAYGKLAHGVCKAT